MATRDEISAKIREFLNDAGIFYTASDINNSLQDGYDETAALSGCIEKIASISFTPNLVYYDMPSLITDFVSVVGIWNRRVKRWMTPASMRQLDQINQRWECTAGEPWIFCPVSLRYVAIYPSPTATGTVATNLMYVVYKAAAGTMIGSTEPEIPLQIQEDILLNYTCMDMFEQAEEWTKAQEYLDLYLQSHATLKDKIDRRDAERLVRLGGSL